MAESYNVAGDSYGKVGAAVVVQIRHRRKQSVRGSESPLGLKGSVAVAEQHRNVTGESVRSYNIREAIAVNNARLMLAPGSDPGSDSLNRGQH
jgi:hypothetical protein